MRKQRAEEYADRPPQLEPDYHPDIPVIDLAWAAGVFEGEGTVTIGSAGKSGYTRMVVMLTSTDTEMVVFFQEHWPNLSLYHVRPKSNNAKAALTWRLSNRRANGFLKTILPYIRTSRVRAKMQLAIESQNARGVQNIYGPARIAQQSEYRQRMRDLNHRGVLPGNVTVAERLLPELDTATGTGRLPPLLLGA